MHIGADEIIRSEDRTVYVALGCKVNDGAGLMLLNQFPGEFAVADISVSKTISWIGRHADQVARITRVGQLVEIDHRSGFLRKPLQDEV